MAKILIADIDAHINQVLKKIFLDEGGDEIYTENRAERIAEMLASARIDIAFIDSEFVSFDENFITLLKTKSLNKSVIIILMAVRDNVTRKVENLNPDIDDYLIKPFSKDEIVFKVSRYLKKEAPAEGVSPDLCDRLLDTVIELSALKNSSQHGLRSMVSLFALRIKEIFNAERITFFLVRDNRLVSYLTENEISEISLEFGEGIVGHAALTGQPYFTNDTYKDPFFKKEIDLATGYTTKNALAFPLISRKRVIGAVELLNCPEGFSAQCLKIVGKISDFISSLLNDMRIEDERSLFQMLNVLLVTDAEIGLVALDPDCRIKLWNRYMEKCYETAYSEVKNRNIFDIFPQMIPEGFRDWISEAVNTKKPVFKKGWIHKSTRRGTRRIDVTIHPFFREDSTLLGLGIINIDKGECK